MSWNSVDGYYVICLHFRHILKEPTICSFIFGFPTFSRIADAADRKKKHLHVLEMRRHTERHHYNIAPFMVTDE